MLHIVLGVANLVFVLSLYVVSFLPNVYWTSKNRADYTCLSMTF